MNAFPFISQLNFAFPIESLTPPLSAGVSSGYAAIVWPIVWPILWQGGLIALLLVVAVRLIRRWPSPLRYALLLLGLVRFALPPLPGLPTGLLAMTARVMPRSFASDLDDANSRDKDVVAASAPSPLFTAEDALKRVEDRVRRPMPPAAGRSFSSGNSEIEPALAVQRDAPANAPRDSWASQAVAAWPWIHLGGALLLAAWAARQIVLLSRLCRRGRRIGEDEALAARFGELASRMGLRYTPELLVVDAAVPPMALGLWRRRVVVPASLPARLSPSELDWVLMHELAHHRRGDLWVNWVQLLLAGLWWFNPALWLLNRAIRRVREECCDDLVLALRQTDADTYGETLVHVARELTRPVLLGGAMGFAARLHPLGGRIRRIMDGTLPRATRLSLAGVVVLTATALVVLPGVGRPQSAASAKTPSSLADNSTTRTESPPLEKKPDAPAEGARSAGAASPAADERRIEITVLDAAGDQPIEGAELTIRYSRTKREEKVGADGRFVVAIPSDAKNSCSITADKDGYLGQSVQYFTAEGEPPPLPAGCTLRLMKAGIIRGKVTDPDGKPLADVKVAFRVQEQFRTDGVPWLTKSVSVSTNTDGMFEFAGWPPSGVDNMQIMSVNLDHPQYLPRTYARSTSIDPNVLGSGAWKVSLADFREGRGVFVVEPDRREPFRVSGQVKDADDLPVASARVVARGNDAGVFRELASAQTDDEGRFNFEALPPRKSRSGDEMTITVEKEGFAAQGTNLGIGAADGVMITLEPTAPVHGVVVDGEGRPIEDAGVALQKMGTMGRNGWKWLWSTKTGADGRFECLFAAENVTLSAYKEGLQPTRLRAPTRGEDITVKLSPKAYIEGRVTAKTDGAPIAKFRVITGTVSQQGAVYWPREGQSIQQSDFRNGEFRMGMLTGDFSSDAFKLRVEAEGFRPLESPVFPCGSESIRWDAQLELVGQYTGRVLRANGAPVEGAAVYGWIGDVSFGLSFSNMTFDKDEYRRDRLWETRTDAQGRFALPNVEDLIVLAALHEDGSALLIRPGADVGDVTLQPWGRIEGQMFQGNSPDARRTVHTWCPVSDQPRSPQVNFSFEAKCDEQGRFSMMARAGENYVSAMEWAEEIRGESTYRPAGYRSLWSADLKVDAEKTTTMQFGKGGRPVTGRIVGLGAIRKPTVNIFGMNHTFPDPPESTKRADGSWDNEAYLQWWNTPENQALRATPSQYEINLDADGRFVIPNVMPGEHYLHGVVQLTSDPNEVIARPDSQRKFQIPASDDASPFDLGDIALLPGDSAKKKTVELQVGQRAPEFTVKTVDGATVRLSDLKGKVVVLDFWATWCGPCVRTIPELIEAYKVYGWREDVVMLGLSMDKSEDALKRGIDEYKIAWPQALITDDAGQALSQAYGVSGIPHIVVVGRTGLIERNAVFGENLTTAIEAALKSGGT